MLEPQCFTLEYLNFKFDFNLSNLKIKIFKGVTNSVNFMPHFSKRCSRREYFLETG